MTIRIGKPEDAPKKEAKQHRCNDRVEDVIQVLYCSCSSYKLNSYKTNQYSCRTVVIVCIGRAILAHVVDSAPHHYEKLMCQSYFRIAVSRSQGRFRLGIDLSLLVLLCKH